MHAIEAHHYEVQPQTVEAVLLIAADAISASRPGARGESLEHYIKRLESLEELAAAKPGVEKVYALQAGREIRVIVKPDEVDDDGAVLLSHEIAREIEDQLEYPGPGEGDGHPREPRDRRRAQRAPTAARPQLRLARAAAAPRPTNTRPEPYRMARRRRRRKPPTVPAASA